MSLTYDHFGKIATFDGDQVPVVQAMIKDYLDLVGNHVLLDIQKEEMEEKLRSKETELQELQKLIDASISNLDPDRQ